MDWASDNGVTFNPAKYAIIHFRNPLKRGVKEPSCLPNISGLTPAVLEKVEFRILGIMVDPQLRWHRHLEHVSSPT